MHGRTCDGGIGDFPRLKPNFHRHKVQDGNRKQHAYWLLDYDR